MSQAFFLHIPQVNFKIEYLRKKKLGKKGTLPGIGGKEVSLGSHCDFGNDGGTGSLPDIFLSGDVGVAWRRRIWRIWIWKGSSLVNIRGEYVKGIVKYHFRLLQCYSQPILWEDITDYCSKYK